MFIHVVQSGETIYSIAADYNVSVTRLVEDNGLVNPENLVVGQTIVIAYPEGSGIWNIMNFFAQMWLVINSQHSINKVLPEI